MSSEPAALGTKAAYDHCNVGKSKWYELMRTGQAPRSFVIGGRRRWLKSTLDNWMKSMEDDAQLDDAEYLSFCSTNGSLEGAVVGMSLAMDIPEEMWPPGILARWKAGKIIVPKGETKTRKEVERSALEHFRRPTKSGPQAKKAK